MDDSIGCAEHPLITVAAYDPHSGFVAGHNIGTTQGPEGIGAPGGKNRSRVIRAKPSIAAKESPLRAMPGQNSVALNRGESHLSYQLNFLRLIWESCDIEHRSPR
jgi:hypothetical protein